VGRGGGGLIANHHRKKSRKEREKWGFGKRLSWQKNSSIFKC
jgi:hypothetical protein